jgi:hypothetical protein
MAFKVNNVDRILSDRINLPSGTTAQRPTSPVQGTLRFNTDDNLTEYWDGGAWVTITGGSGGGSSGGGTPPPPSGMAFGDPYGGGYYMGITCSVNGACYYLIVSPNATGCACCAWKTSLTSTAGTCSLVDGYANTYPALNNTTHPAGHFTATRTINGFSDWYLPAINELSTIYNNGGNSSGTTLPAGERFAANCYWSSTVFSAPFACLLNVGNGNRNNVSIKTISNRFRSVRRVPI